MIAAHKNPTQAQVILDHLNNGGSLTALDALNQFGCFRLAARIHELRREGHQIEESTINRDGKSYSSYFIKTFTLEYA